MPQELGHPSATQACIIQSELSAILRPPRAAHSSALVLSAPTTTPPRRQSPPVVGGPDGPDGVARGRGAAPRGCPGPAAVVVPPACECECESSADARAGLSDRPDITATARPTTATSGTAVSDRTGRLATLC